MSSYTEGLHITDNPACNEFMRGEWGDFPRIQFDCGLGAELASDETADINEDALRETLEKIGVPEERWGDITLTVTSNKNRLICQRIWRAALIPPRTAGLRLQ